MPPTITPNNPRQEPPPSPNHAAHHHPAVMSSTANNPSIAATQENKQQEIDAKYNNHAHDQRETDAARVLQRTYRGYRERRQLAGLSLDPSTRWTEAIKEAQYRELTRPRPRTSDSTQELEDGDDRRSEARKSWRRVGGIARRAGGNDQADGGPSPGDGDTNERVDEQKRTKSTQIMDLSYFLEMVDLNHRYGSNLRKYHAEWKRRGTRENFFYWLDHGDGKELSLENCSRERLDSMRVRYLSKEERLNYLTMVDGQGRLCWKKNGIRIDTSVEWKDSAIGIVPIDDKTPTYSENDAAAAAGALANPSSDADSAGSSGDETSKSEKKTTEVPPGVILNRLVRKFSTKSQWIFVADTSFNLYVGIKQSGAFQHSSFLHGSRISSAGLIKIRDGKIRLLQPRSGHYRPPASNFLAFIHALRAKGVDMSATSFSASYAALIGIEGYMKGKSTLKEMKGKSKEVVSPEPKNKEHDEEEEDRKVRSDGKDEQDQTQKLFGQDTISETSDNRVLQMHRQTEDGDQPGRVGHGTQHGQKGEHQGLKASLIRKMHIGGGKS